MFMYTCNNNIYIAISCPYSRAEHIPCQNSWEISGIAKTSFRWKLYFIQFAKYSFSSGTYVVDCTCSSPKKILTFNNFGNVIINKVELSKNGLIMFLWEFVIYTFQDLKTQFISLKLMFWHAWLAFHQQRHPHLSWHLCGPAKSSAQQDLGTQINDDPVFFRVK